MELGMTASTGEQGNLLPQTRLGWWSVGLVALVTIVAPLASLVTGAVIGFFVDEPLTATTSDAIYVTIPCAIVAIVLGMVAIVRGRDHSVLLVVLTCLMSVLMTFAWAQEFVGRS